MRQGHIIFLNGTSSSGKTTLAKALQERLPEPYMHVSADIFFDFYPKRVLSPTGPEELQALARLVLLVVSGLHRSVAALAAAGNNVVVDHVLQEPGWLEECVERWAGLEVLFVGVRCPLPVAERRERERGDREPGTATYQYERVHTHGVYDVEVDTSVLTPQACVEQILEAMERGCTPGAFTRLRRGFITQEPAAPGSAS